MPTTQHTNWEVIVKLLVFLMCALTVSALPARARLEETLQDCDKRYGRRKVDGFSPDARIEDRGYVEYVKDGIVISLHFTGWNSRRAKVDEITYKKGDPDGYFSQEEVQSLLAANKGSADAPADGKVWQIAQVKRGKTKQKEDYVRFDGKARARVFLTAVGSGNLAQKITVSSHVDDELKEKVGARGGEKLDAIQRDF